MANLLDDICNDAPVLSAPLSRPKGITKRQVERCIHELAEHWSDEQLNDVIDMFQPTACFERMAITTKQQRQQRCSEALQRDELIQQRLLLQNELDNVGAG